MTNRLIHETSPYLLQHAANPVDWFPWGEEALRQARAEEKPIFLSIGYSACHWCHVMAHESFEDARTAAVLNEHFVNIKVDREERPDLDRIYMSAVQSLTGRGGWPMSVFLAPDGRPFYGGTYFPAQPRYGMPAFVDVLMAVAAAWEHRRAELLEGSRRLTAAIEQEMNAALGAPIQPLSRETLHAAFRQMERDFDPVHGGWGGAPKFPQPMALEFLLRHHQIAEDGAALRMVEQTLQAMARGGVYDQLGGGFHRYSVDERWTTPHFEKMLYDNAQLARVYLHAWQATGDGFYRTIAEETLDYLLREMSDPAGGFYSAQDADSEGEEGKFYLWTPAEIHAVLGDEAERFIAAYGVTEEGNFEGRNILELKGDPAERDQIADARRRLFEARRGRVPPGRDEKAITSWNGLTLAAFAEATRLLGRQDHRQAAERNADFLLREMRAPDGRLYHTWRGGAVKGTAYLEDYAQMIDGLLELHAADGDERWRRAAQELAEGMLAHFRAPVGFYDTADDHEPLIVRPREVQDNAVPSGNAAAAAALIRLARLGGETRYLEPARAALGAIQPLLARYPLAFAHWLTALSDHLTLAREQLSAAHPR